MFKVDWSPIGSRACAFKARSAQKKCVKRDAAIENHIFWLFDRLRSLGHPQKRLYRKTGSKHFRLKLQRSGTPNYNDLQLEASPSRSSRGIGTPSRRIPRPRLRLHPRLYGWPRSRTLFSVDTHFFCIIFPGLRPVPPTPAEGAAGCSCKAGGCKAARW